MRSTAPPSICLIRGGIRAYGAVSPPIFEEEKAWIARPLLSCEDYKVKPSPLFNKEMNKRALAYQDLSLS